MAGGGPVLTEAVEHRPRDHTSANVMRLVGRAFGDEAADGSPTARARLALPEEARRAAARLVAGSRPLIGVHASGGREVKQWSAERFAEVAARLARDRDAVIVLTGATRDRPLVERVKTLLGPAITTVVVAGNDDLVTLAAVLERLDLFITGDTGPMHLAAAVGTPIVAIFGPSDPARYGPLAAHSRIVRVDLPCSPCNRIRTPPARCVGHVPDCLEAVPVDRVVAAAAALLDTPGRARLASGTSRGIAAAAGDGHA
jgi:ADP-heptose:LPS heptosyltransferase